MGFKKQIAGLFFLLIAGLSQSFASQPQIDASQIKSTATTTVTIGQPSATTNVEMVMKTGAFIDVQTMDVVTLAIDANYPTYFANAMNVKVKVSIQQWDKHNNSLATLHKYLNVRYHPFDTASYVDKNSQIFNSAYKLIVTIDSIYVNGVSKQILPANLTLDAHIAVTRYFDFTLQSKTTVILNPADSVDENCDGIYDQLQVSWPNVTGAERYDLEWTFVDDYDVQPGTFIPRNLLNYDFRHNSTRVSVGTLTPPFYNISLTFEHGYILYRVRAIGQDVNNLANEVVGVWSAPNIGTIASLNDRYHVLNPHEGNKNWQFSATYAEEGKKKEVITYHDGSLRNRQSVTKMNSDHNTIVGETIYDNQGRPAITVLPVPVAQPNCTNTGAQSTLKFYPNFTQDDSTHAYTVNDFDTNTGDSCSNNAAPMGTNSGASQYYSPNNPNKTGFQAFVPDARKYPFVQTEYTPDNTGRVRRQGGVGADHQLGSNHETKYFYGQPDQIELDRLFGSEMGDYTHYKKTFTIDPNGQISVSYYNQEGKVVATALAGDTTLNTSALPSYASGGHSITQDLFNKDAKGHSNMNTVNITHDGIDFSTEFLVTSAGTYNFNYNLKVDTLEDKCLKIHNVCFYCVYDLGIKVTDSCGANIAKIGGQPISKKTGKFSMSGSQIVFLTAPTAGGTPFSEADGFSMYLRPGNYSVTKNLSIDTAAENFYVKKYLDSTLTCTKTLYNFQQQFLAGVDTTSCNISCQTCVASLGKRDDFVSQGKGTSMDYDFLVQQCQEPCKQPSLCQNSYDMMLSDMAPGGQYAQFVDPNGNTNPSSFPLSILNTGNSLPQNHAASLGNWKYPVVNLNGNNYTDYIDDNGALSKIVVTPQGAGIFSPPVDNANAVLYDTLNAFYYTYPKHLQNVKDFIASWKISWEQSLVQYHPEYCYYSSCSPYTQDQNTTDKYTSDAFDQLIESDTTFKMAVADGLIKTNYPSIATVNSRVNNWFTYTANLPYDPFVVYSSTFNGYGAQLQNKFNTYLTSSTGTYSMIEWAAVAARCGNNINILPNQTCTRFGDDYISGGPIKINDSIRNLEWNYLKTFYVSFKQQLQQQRGNSLAITSCQSFNGCIGDKNYNPSQDGMIRYGSVSTYLGSPFFQAIQPCGQSTYPLYVAKVKRFPDVSDIPAGDANAQAYQVYLQTGECPVAMDMQALLNAVASRTKLNSANESLNGYNEYVALFIGLNNMAPQAPIPTEQWRATSVNADSLSVNFFNTQNSSIECTLALSKKGSPIANWGNIIGFTDLQSQGQNSMGLFSFTILAEVATGTTVKYYPLTGTTCYDLDNCQFKDVCKPNDFASNVQNLMSSLAANSKLTATAVNLQASPYSLFITPAILNTIGVSANTLRWSYMSSTKKFILYDNLNSAHNVTFSVASFIPSGFSLANLTAIKSFKSIEGKYVNNFDMVGYDINNNKLVTINGKVLHHNSATDSSAVTMGNCDLPTPGECTGDPYAVTNDLAALLSERLSTQNINQSIDLYKSPAMTSLLKHYFNESDLSTSSKRDSIVVGTNLYDTLLFKFLPDSECFLKLTLHPHSGINFKGATSSLSSVSNIVFLNTTGTPDYEGNYHNFYMIAQYKATALPVGPPSGGGTGTGGTIPKAIRPPVIIMVDTIFGQTCLPLRVCSPCPKAVPGFLTYDTLTVISPVSTGEAVPAQAASKYQEYVNAIDSLDARMGWPTSSSNYITPITYKDFFFMGQNFPLPQYLSYVNNYIPGIDNYTYVAVPDSFVINYGYATNVELEYQRYIKAVSAYNTRALSLSSPTITAISDSLFSHGLFADSLFYYVNYLQIQPIGLTPAKSVSAYMIPRGYAYQINDSCSILYKHYVEAYDFFTRNHRDSVRCPNFSTDVPLYSFNSVKKNNLCCSNAGYTVFNQYIHSFYDTTVCPGNLPNLLSCYSTAQVSIDTQACQKNYTLYRSYITRFNQSNYVSVHHDTLPLIYKNFSLFLRAGLCSCINSYISYLGPYLSNKVNTSGYPLPLDIDHYGPCQLATPPVLTACDTAYSHYLNAIANYDQQAIAKKLPTVRFIYKQDQFTSAGLCYCLDHYIANLQGILDGLVIPSRNVDGGIESNISISCSTPPCTPSTRLDTTPAIIMTAHPDPCKQYMIDLAMYNASQAYTSYRDSVSGAIRNKYVTHCLGAVENFTKTFFDREYHFTLYYYDQAGNLIKTVPPEGVHPLAITSSTDAQELQVIADRTNGTHSVFTFHTLASIYEYNSLNQLVKQSIPDHDQMNIWETTLPNGLNSALVTTAVQFLDNSRGYLSGYIQVNANLTRGYVYQTFDGGHTWQRITGTVASDLRKIQMIGNTGYAVGNSGIVLKTTTAGQSWDMLNLYGNNVMTNFTDLYFINANEGIIAGGSTIVKTTDGGATFTVATNITPAFTANDTIVSVTNDGPNYYLALHRKPTGNNPSLGAIYSSNVGSGLNWNQQTSIRASDLTKVQYFDNNNAYVAGIDGQLMELNHSAGTYTALPTAMNYKIVDEYFSTASNGLAILQTTATAQGLYKTLNGGQTWQIISAPGDFYNSLYGYYNVATYGAKVIAVGKNGQIARVIMQNNSAFGMIVLNKPTSTANLTTAWAEEEAITGQVLIAACDDLGNLYYSTTGDASTVLWTPVTIPILAADKSIKKILIHRFGTGTALTLSGTLLTQNGKLYSVFKNATNVFSFPVFGAPSHSSINATDIVLDDANQRVYAYNFQDRQVYKAALNGTSATVSGFLVTGSTQALTSPRSLAYRNNHITLAGTGGELYTASLNFTGAALTGPWVNLSSTMLPLPLNDIQFSGPGGSVYSVGNDGTVLQKNGTTWNILASSTAQKLNAIKFATNNVAIIVGDKGTILQGPIGTNVIFSSPLASNTTQNLNDLVIVPSTNNVYVAGNNGTLLFCSDYTLMPFTVTNQGTTNNFYGLSQAAVGNSAIAVGQGNMVDLVSGGNRVFVKEIFTPKLKNLNFIDQNDGYVVGDNYTLRHTSNGGVSWSIVLPQNFNSGMPVLNAVWSNSANNGLAVGGSNYIASLTTNSATQLSAAQNPAPNNWTFYDLKFNGLKGFAVGQNGAGQGAFKISNNGGQTWTDAGIYSGTEWNKLHIFPNNSFIVVGNGAKAGYYNGSTLNTTGYSPTGGLGLGADNFNDVFFHDDVNGYIVGNNGVVLKTTAASLSTTGFLNPVSWIRIRTKDNLNGQTDSTKMNIQAIGFATRLYGFMGGSYNGNPPGYARVIHDEAQLYSVYNWYDMLGRIILSQNTKQFNQKSYSYINYDVLGRIEESGEKYENIAAGSLHFTDLFGAYVNSFYNPLTIDTANFSKWQSDISGMCKDVSHSFYDAQFYTTIPLVQQNLRKRIASSTFEALDDHNSSTFDYASHYSYDIHGNVNSLLQDNPKTGIANQEYKRIDYDYDLISGKTNDIHYQDGKLDAFHHHYEYDEDNRVKLVYSSKYPKARSWEISVGLYDTDEKDLYYAHGLIARKEIGDLQVQGSDYAFTLMGWIKGENSNTLNPQTDIGQDGYNTPGNSNRNFARDVFGFSINFYGKDYQPIDYINKWQNTSSRFESQKVGSDLSLMRSDLFNGNISSMVTTLTNPINYQTMPLGSSYKYDQLNRLTESRSFSNIDTVNNNWGNGSTYANKYFNRFTYDANGNILTQRRNDANGGAIDSLRYHYAKDQNGNLIQNRLYHVNDAVPSSSFSDDIDDQGIYKPGIATINFGNNYNYDEIGQLRKDSAEGVQKITWTAFNKVKTVTRYSGSIRKNLVFDYDAIGNRTAKHVFNNNNIEESTTYYIKDLQGNIMSIYDKELNSSNAVASYTQIENDLYGSKRVGMETTVLEMIAPPPIDTSIFSRILGYKYYEMTNHLGNVLATISDKKIPHDDNLDGTVDRYSANIISASDYTAYGSEMYGRCFNSKHSQNGFNHKRKDNELYPGGDGNEYDYGMRLYNPRLGKFMSLDPLMRKYPFWSPYQFAGSVPIAAIDLDGGELKSVVAELGEHADGTLYITKIDDVKILDNWSTKIDGVEYAETVIVYKYNGFQTLQEIYEPVDYGQLGKGYGGLKASAKYDYGSSKSMKQKIDDDLNFMYKQGSQLDPLHLIGLNRAIYLRDSKAPDAQYQNQGINDVVEAAMFAGIPLSRGFRSEELLVQHFEKHGAEFGGELKTAKDYESAAQKFITSHEKGIETYKRANGDLVRYNKATNEFGIIDKEGTIRTYFKPKLKMKYYEQEKAKDLGSTK
jgi:RHS repeat-associated protein